MDSEHQQLNELLDTLERRRQVLEQQAAYFGPHVPPHIKMQIEDVKKKRDEIYERQNLSVPVICELPPDVLSFTGRREQLAAILGFLEKAAHDESNAPRISLITGMPGVGKSTLAVHAAYRLKKVFPDQQLYVNLRRKDGEPLKPLDVLASFLRVLGIKEQNLPKDMDGRRSMYRHHMSKKLALLVLDNANDEEQILPLIPQSAKCAVLVTSRKSLALFRDEQVIDLKVMTEAEALSLLEEHIGEERVNAELQYAKQILELCNWLPLAIRIIGGTLKIQPDEKLEDYAREFADEHQRLERLRSSYLDVGSSINLSYRVLEDHIARLFRSLGFLSGSDFTEQVAAEMLDVPLEVVKQDIHYLVDIHLLESASSGRYRLHELVRLFAMKHLDLEESADEQRRIIERMVEFFVLYAEKNEENYSALDLEAGNIYGALELAHTWDLQSAVVRGANALRLFFDTRGLYDRAERYLQWAEQAAEALHDDLGLAKTKRSLGLLKATLHKYDEAEQFFVDGLSLARRTGDSATISALLHSLGKSEFDRGHYIKAEAHFREALAIAHANDDHRRIVGLLADLGVTEYTRGNYQESEKCYQDGLDRSHKIASKRQIIELYVGLGWTTTHRYGDYRRGEEHWQKGLELAHHIDYFYMINHIQTNLGWAADRRGNSAYAEEYFSQSLEFSNSHDYRAVVCATHINAGVMALHRGHYAEADVHLSTALALCRQIQVSQHTGVVLENLGILACRRGNYSMAAYYLEKGLNIVHETYTERTCALRTYLGETLIRRGKYEQAATYLESARNLARDLKHNERMSVVLERLGELRIHQGKLVQAQEYLENSLTLARSNGYRWLICSVLNTFGEAHLAGQQFDLASDKFEQSLRDAGKIESLDQIAIAKYGLARVEEVRGDTNKARQLGQESLEILEIMGHYKAVNVAQWLKTLS